VSETELIELARAYVALSNAHRVDLIRPMFTAEAVYRSSAVGEHQGATAIVTMMQGFFARYPDVHWQCDDFRCAGRRVSFRFELQAHDLEDGSQLRRNGVEHIAFDSSGLIELLEVQAA
jgi:nuclear transport factor 2 (NTF2) superfamily protein